MRLTTVNKAIVETGLELIRGEGYFYFIGEGSERLKSASVYVPRLNDISLERWIEEAKSMREEINSTDRFNPDDFVMKISPRKI